MRAMLRTPTIVAVGAAALIAIGGIGAPARAAERLDADRNPWAPWIGCWELTIERDSSAAAEEAPEGTRSVCLSEGDEPLSVVMTTSVDDETVMTQEIHADGLPRDVDEQGCTGSETAAFSADGERLLVSGEHTCDGVAVRTSGITLLLSADRWSDIQVSEVDGQREVLVRRYRRVETGPESVAGLATFASRVVRQASSAPLDADDVIEAVGVVDTAAVEAMLVEKDDPFPMSSDLLLRLADANVPGSVIDLMVALTYPDYFLVDDGSAQPEEDGDRSMGVRYRGLWAYPWYGYGYYDPFFAPFGYSYYYRPTTWIYGGGGGGGFGGSRFGGKVVKGRGYIRVRPTSKMPSGGLGRLFRSDAGRSVGGGRSGVGRSGGSSGSGGTVTPSGATRSGGSSSGRTAKPRGGGSKRRGQQF